MLDNITFDEKGNPVYPEEADGCSSGANADGHSGGGIQFTEFRNPKVEAAKQRLMANSIWARHVQVNQTSRYVIKGVLAPDSVAAVYGEPGSGKSFLALDMALCVAMGIQWRGKRVKQGCVIYVAAEGGTGMLNRIAAARAKYSIHPDTNIPLLLLHCPVNMLVPEEVEAFSEIVSEAAENTEQQTGLPVSMVVIDTLARSMAGGNENAGETMGAFIGACDKIRETSGANVLIVHHCGKNKAMGMRGHSSLLGAVDTEIELNKEGEENGAKVAVAKITKQKDGEDGMEFPFYLNVVPIGSDDEGDPITTCIVGHITEDGWKAPTAKDSLKPQERSFLDILNELTAQHSLPLPPGPGFPSSHAYGVPYELVRKEFCSREGGITSTSTDQEKNTARATARRTRATLARNHKIGSCEEWIWPVAKDEGYAG